MTEIASKIQWFIHGRTKEINFGWLSSMFFFSLSWCFLFTYAQAICTSAPNKKQCGEVVEIVQGVGGENFCWNRQPVRRTESSFTVEARKRLTQNGRQIVRNDNARAHIADSVEVLFKSRQWVHLPHLPYSSDMNPCDFNCFNHLKRELPDFHTIDLTTNQNLIWPLERCRKKQNGTFSGVQKLLEIWQHVVDCGGDYC